MKTESFFQSNRAVTTTANPDQIFANSSGEPNKSFAIFGYIANMRSFGLTSCVSSIRASKSHFSQTDLPTVAKKKSAYCGKEEERQAEAPKARTWVLP